MIYHYVLVDNLMFISELQCVFNLKFRNLLELAVGEINQTVKRKEYLMKTWLCWKIK